MNIYRGSPNTLVIVPIVISTGTILRFSPPSTTKTKLPFKGTYSSEKASKYDNTRHRLAAGLMTHSYVSALMLGIQFSRSSRTIDFSLIRWFWEGEGAREFISLFFFLILDWCLSLLPLSLFCFPPFRFLVISLPINSCVSLCLICL